MGHAATLFMGIMVCGILVSCGNSPRPDALGDGTPAMSQLSACPDSPNCHCSEDKTSSAWIAPLIFEGEPDHAWQKVTTLVATLGGEIIVQDDDYLHAVFTSSFLRFKDDLELRLDSANKTIHVRSASRVGYSDFGVNRRRIERLRGAFAAQGQ
ncbi:MAG: DUF1499 domain-containing protein [Desulfobulbaceae bacterium]|nr:DUF1499 domain-containing protein [Desulfobulbaceae bacterium]